MCIYFNTFSKDLFIFSESQIINSESILSFKKKLFSVAEDILNFFYANFNKSYFENFFENLRPMLDHNSLVLKIFY